MRSRRLEVASLKAKLDRIRALCDEADEVFAFQPPGVVSTDYLRAVLDR